MRHTLPRLLAAALCAAALSQPAHAQNTVVLEGLVKSATAPLGGAQVTVVNTATQETVRATSRGNWTTYPKFFPARSRARRTWSSTRGLISRIDSDNSRACASPRRRSESYNA